jgi:hypothetical protein
MNTKHPLYKEKIRLQNESVKLSVIQRNQNWIELETPYISGYYMVFDLRDDIKNRDDAWVFYECIRLVGKKAWSKSKSFKRKIKKGKYEYIFPEFGQVSEETYKNLHPAVKKYFSEISWFHKNWHPMRKAYACRVPSYFFVYKTEPRWITHYKEIDSVIAQEEAEIDDQLWSGKMRPVNSRFGERGGLASYARCHNRSDRRVNKQTLQRNIMNGGEDMDKYEYRYNHRHSALWEYW